MNALKIILKSIGVILLGVMVIVASYLLYVWFSYYRLPDNLALEVYPAQQAVETETEESGRASVSAGEEYSIVSYNIGFGAYTPDYSFFMDGGTESWAFSKEAVWANVTGAGTFALGMDPDFVLFQEIDVDSTRSYHVNELSLLQGLFSEYNNVFAQNFDSAFLMYPLTQPHGANKAGMGTFSKYEITGSLRRSFPISTGFSKLVDLDRGFSVSRINVDNGKELVLVNLHMSAYGNSDAVREGQTSLLREVMETEYAAGNYVILGGDFNHDLTNMSSGPGAVQWAYPYERTLLAEHFDFAMDLLGAEGRQALWDSCRDAKETYSPSNYTLTVDGFIISDNVKLISYENVNTGYQYSDHEPVLMRFELE